MKKILLTSLVFVCFGRVSAQNWQACNAGPQANSTVNTTVCVHKNKLYQANSVKGLQVSTDNGNTWTVVNSSITFSVDLLSTGDRLYSFQGYNGCTEILSSSNDGVSFTLDTLALPTCYAGTTLRPSTGIYGGTATWQNHVIMSLAGPDWEWSRNTADSSWQDATYFDANDCGEFVVKNDTCWAATNGATSNGVAWSIDGINWTSPATIGLPPYYVPTSIAWNGNRLFMMGGDVGAANAGADTILKYSDDYGINFADVNIKQYLDQYAFFSYTGKQPTFDIFTAYNKIYLIVGQDALESAPELLVSSDNGLTFQKDTVGFPSAVLGSNLQITKMVSLNGWVFAQLNQGDLYRKQLGPTSIDNNQFAPTDFTVYPNPASETISIMPATSIKTIKIFDVTGKLILNETNATFNVSKFNAGMYNLVIENTAHQTFRHKLLIQ